MRYIVIPKGISKPIFESQIVGRFHGLEIRFVSYDREQELVADLEDFSSVIEGDIIYFRSVTDFFRYKISSVFSRKKVITEFDFRGIISEESYLRNRCRIRRLLLSWLEFFAFKYSDRLFSVSNNLASYLVKKFYSKDIVVIPCCVPADICILKDRSSKHKELRFIYVGSMSEWQSFDNICELYSSVDSELTSLTVVTKDRVKANQILQNYMIQAVVLSGDKNFVLKQLDRADFGFIYRANSIINTTSSPVKFLEYTARGVIPVMSPYVGDYSHIFQNISYTVRDSKQKMNVEILARMRADANTYRELFKLTNNFSWETYFDR